MFAFAQRPRLSKAQVTTNKGLMAHMNMLPRNDTKNDETTMIITTMPIPSVNQSHLSGRPRSERILLMLSMLQLERFFLFRPFGP